MSWSWWALILLLAACAGDPPTPTGGRAISVIDDNGRSVVLPHSATRVISLVPVATEMVAVLRAGHVLVGRTAEDGVGRRFGLPSVGRVLDPSVEMILTLRPDLVIAWADADGILSRLAKAGVPTYGARFERLAAGPSNLRRIGALLGLAPGADSLAGAMARDLETIRARATGRHRPSVLYVLDSDPLWTAGPGTFVDDLIEIAGGRNIFHDLPTKWSQVSVEAVIARQPDVIIVAQPKTRSASLTWLRQAGWRELDAVRQQRVHVVDADSFNHPGPGAPITARRLAGLLHPQMDR